MHPGTYWMTTLADAISPIWVETYLLGILQNKSILNTLCPLRSDLTGCILMPGQNRRQSTSVFFKICYYYPGILHEHTQLNDYCVCWFVAINTEAKPRLQLEVSQRNKLIRVTLVYRTDHVFVVVVVFFVTLQDEWTIKPKCWIDSNTWTGWMQEECQQLTAVERIFTKKYNAHSLAGRIWLYKHQILLLNHWFIERLRPIYVRKNNKNIKNLQNNINVTWLPDCEGHRRADEPLQHLPLTSKVSLGGTHCWAMMRGMLSDCSGEALSPVRLLNIGNVDRGAGMARFPAMLLSSSVFPWMVRWWYSWILQHMQHHFQHLYRFMESRVG